MKIRHYFAGGNTPRGFYSFYEEVMPPKEACFTVYMKGGPGTGKSTLMKKWGSALAEQGYEMEFLHCSGDPSSLDGIVLRKNGLAILDGTAPHAQDPQLLGAVDRIFDPGRFMDTEKVRPFREMLLEFTAAKKAAYSLAYQYLSMAGTLFSGMGNAVRSALRLNAVEAEAEELADQLFGKRSVSVKRGYLRPAFATAVTPLGMMGYLNTLFLDQNVYQIMGEQGVGCDCFLNRLADAAVMRGFLVEAYYSPLDPCCMEHLVIPELNLAFTGNSEIPAQKTVDLLPYFDRERLLHHERNFQKDRQLLSLLLERCVTELQVAKEEHARMEEIFTPAMDFEGMEDAFSQMMRQALERIG